MKILVTGAAGFIGFHLVSKLVQNSNNIIYCVDNINEYYSINLKYDRLTILGFTENDINQNKFINSTKYNNCFFAKVNIDDNFQFEKTLNSEYFDQIIHLAAQAGVRYSLENPRAYIQSNIAGFLNILEYCRQNKILKLLYASSSSVYGMSNKEILSESDCTDFPISLYAATKKSNEVMAHVYSHLYNIQTIGLRFFTVYGPWGRPDMAPFIFTDSILNNKEIKVYNNGEMLRDFTYIDDIIDGIYKISTNNNNIKYKIYNIGNNKPVKLLDFINTIESELGISAKKVMLDIQPGDVKATWANIENLSLDTDYKPLTTVEVGVGKYIKWFINYYNY